MSAMYNILRIFLLHLDRNMMPPPRRCITAARPRRCLTHPGGPARNTSVHSKPLGDIFLELDRVGGEDADALGGFLRGHGAFVEQPAELLLVEIDPFNRGFLGDRRAELAG